MSSTLQATSSTSSTSNIQLITNALVDYEKITGIDLSNNPFASVIKQANSPEAILELLQEREKAFKDYREGNRRLISCLSPAVNVIQAFSGILGEAVSLVSDTRHLVTLLTWPRQVPFPPVKALFVGIDVLLSVRPFNTLFNQFPCDIWVCQAASGVTSSYDALMSLFECLGSFLKRMEIYTTIPPTPILTEVVVKIIVELLSVLALASKQIKQGRLSK
jgi:fungal STAND N-terminal Goodbye domain